jgi:4-alpha-glucanotransferase
MGVGLTDTLTMKEEYQELILQLAQQKGIDPEYRDIWGQNHLIPLETQVRMLSTLGVPVDDLENLKKEVQEEESKDWKRLTHPLLIVDKNALPGELFFHIPVPFHWKEEKLPEDIQVELKVKKEDGNLKVYYYTSDQLRFKEKKELENFSTLRGSLPFPQGLPLGYHSARLTLILVDRRLEQTLAIIVCPDRSYLPSTLRDGGKRAGLVVALASLRSENDWGIGDLGDLKALVRWTTHVLGVDVLGLLPLHALSNREPYNISPYYPSSRFYRNPIYLNVPGIEEYVHGPEEEGGMLDLEARELIHSLRMSERVLFEQVAALKRRILEKVFRVFLERHWQPLGQETIRQNQFRGYVDREGDLLNHFAVYCALEDHFQREYPEFHTWGKWPAPFQDPNSPEVKTFAKDHWQEVLFYKFLQWQLEEQLSAVQDEALAAGADIGLYHDLALGIDPWGADSWAWRVFFVSGIRVGAPPDDYSLEGQEWGFYPPDQQRYREDGYQFFVRTIRKNSRPGGALRIDHILQFARLFWILEGELPKDGAYVRYSLEEYLKILALESVRNKTLIIGEDLGTIPDQLREALNRYGVLSYRLFYFEKNESGNLISPEDYPESALASVSTHDLPPLKGYWSLQDIKLRKEMGLFLNEESFHRAMMNRIMDKRKMIDSLLLFGFLSQEEALEIQAQEEPELTEKLHRAVLAFLVTTQSKLAVISQEDLLRDKNQFNLPGTITEYPNWSRKMIFSIEELWDHPEAWKMADRYRQLIEGSGRALKKS